jgi:type IV pilus assembly protein PilX
MFKNHATKKQLGITLPVVLMFLLVLTVSASFGIRRSTTSEATSRNQLDYEISRQAAEAALRDGELDILLDATKPAGALCERSAGQRPIRLKSNQNNPTNVTTINFTTDCANGQCGFTEAYYQGSVYATNTNPQPWWPKEKDGLWKDGRSIATCDFLGGVPIGTYTGKSKIVGVAMQPEYIIENFCMGDQTIFRITARGFGADARTETVVQSFVELKI